MNKPHAGVNLWNAAGIVAPGPEGLPLVAGCESLTPAYINQTPASVLSDYILRPLLFSLMPRPPPKKSATRGLPTHCSWFGTNARD